MKTKKFGEKLALNKKTIANLGNVQLGKVRGGESGFETGCCFTISKMLGCIPGTCECTGLTCDRTRCNCVPVA